MPSPENNNHISRDGYKPRVSVIIPAFNAEKWIERSLSSVRRQTITDIEIIVVDDGSTDDTAFVVEREASRDRRIRIIRQPNGGVARARNAGIAAARADFIAPIDADDLWHPTRLAQHLDAFEHAGEDVGVVYSPFVRIDEQDDVEAEQHCMALSGNVFECHLAENFVGNGSGITVRSDVAREVGGYSPELRDRAGQGAEDWLFQLRAAHRWKFLCVPLYLVAYRRADGNMSSDYLQMARSSALVMREIETHVPDVARPVFWWPQARACGQLAFRLAMSGAWAEALSEIARETMRNPLVPFYLPVVLANRIHHRIDPLIRLVLPPKPRPSLNFYDADPGEVRWGAPTLSTQIWVRIYKWMGARRLAARSLDVSAAAVDQISAPKTNAGILK